jgi:hypothetical protein
LDTTFVRTALLKHVIRGKIAGKVGEKARGGKGISSYWMTLKKLEDTGNLERKH